MPLLSLAVFRLPRVMGDVPADLVLQGGSEAACRRIRCKGVLGCLLQNIGFHLRIHRIDLGLNLDGAGNG